VLSLKVDSHGCRALSLQEKRNLLLSNEAVFWSSEEERTILLT